MGDLDLLLLSLIAFLVVTGLFLWVSARRLRRQAGLPFVARVVYADTGAWHRTEMPLYSSRLRLTGKPDYLVEAKGEVIPIEVKPSRTAAEPYLSDVMQLMAYGALVQDEWGRRPSHGLLKYRDRVFRIDFSPQLYAELIQTLASMRQVLSRDIEQPEGPSRSHDAPWRCRVCGFRDSCDQALE